MRLNNTKIKKVIYPSSLIQANKIQKNTLSIWEILLQKINTIRNKLNNLCILEAQEELFIPLCINEEIIKRFKLTYLLYHKNSYYLPKNLYDDRISQFLPLYFLEQSSTILFPEIIPTNLLNYQLRSFISAEVWTQLVARTIYEYNNTCYICGTKDENNICDEKWVYSDDGVNGTSFFVGLFLYCKDCFIVKNYRNYNLNTLNKQLLQSSKISHDISFEEHKQISVLVRFTVMNKETIEDTICKVRKYILSANHKNNINWEINLMVLQKKYSIVIDTKNLIVSALY